MFVTITRQWENQTYHIYLACLDNSSFVSPDVDTDGEHCITEAGSNYRIQLGVSRPMITNQYNVLMYINQLKDEK